MFKSDALLLNKLMNFNAEFQSLMRNYFVKCDDILNKGRFLCNTHGKTMYKNNKLGGSN